MNKYLVIGAASAGLALVFLAYRGAGKAVELAKDAAQAINPMNNENVFNKGFTHVYQATGANNSTLGGDVYDLWHLGAHPTNEQIKQAPMGAGVALEAYQWITGSTGNQVDDLNNWWEGLWK